MRLSSKRSSTVSSRRQSGCQRLVSERAQCSCGASVHGASAGTTASRRERGGLGGWSRAGRIPPMSDSDRRDASLDLTGGDAELAGGCRDRDHRAIVSGWSDGSGGDLVVGAQSGDAVGGERVASAGAPSLAGEDRGDLLIGVALGELAHERDRVLVGAASVAGGALQRHAVLGDRAALPHDPQLGRRVARSRGRPSRRPR